MCICVCQREVPAEARRVFVDSHGAGVTGSFELLDMGARNRIDTAK